MKICIKNCILVSMENEQEQIEYNKDIIIENNKIIKIGNNLNVDNEYKIIDSTNKVVMPGLINTHAHIPMSIFRETLDGYTLQDWLNNKIWPMEDKLTKSDIYYASYLSFIEMIKTGTTTANDLYFITEDIIKAMLEAGVRLQTTRSLMNIDGEEAGEKRLNELENLIKEYATLKTKLDELEKAAQAMSEAMYKAQASQNVKDNDPSPMNENKKDNGNGDGPIDADFTKK